MKVAAAAVAVALTSAPAVDVSKFRYERTVVGGGDRIGSFDPDARMFAHADPEFPDLRVLDADGRQVPWRFAPETAQPPREARVLNAGREGGAAVALLDLGPERVERDRIVLEVPAGTFVGRVEVFGSDDRRTFTRLSSTPIYDVQGVNPARSTAAVFPPSDFRYYRVRATGVGRILGATAADAADAPRLEERDAEVETEQRGKATLVRADLGFRRVPVDELRISSATQAFDRPVVVSGSNDGRVYDVLGGGRVFRFGAARETTVPVQALHRYLRVRIDNGDDEPLRDLRVTLLARPRTILLAADHKPPFRVLYGARLAPPQYDFAQIPVPRTGFAALTLGAEHANPDFARPRDTRSFVERNDWLVQAALALAAVALGVVGFAVFRRRAAA